MLEINIENIRTFAGSHTAKVAPLTILTGENSAGKSTFLAGLATVLDPDGFPFNPGFNRPPYSLGNYDTIATYKGGKYGRAKHFSLGFKTDRTRESPAVEVSATFRSRGGQVEVESFALRDGDLSVELHVAEELGPARTGEIRIEGGKTKETVPITVPSTLSGQGVSLADLLLRGSSEKLTSVQVQRRFGWYERTRRMARRVSPYRAISIAPIRSRPERTYGQVADSFDPGGDHIPFIIERMLREEPSSPQTGELINALERFGVEAGLFKDVKVRSLGNKAGDPFQLMLNMGGPSRNLIDVGYGVSQALPVVVQSVLLAREGRLLLQQPEVHLHPKAQAALGSLFAELTASGRKSFVLETHSDYLIDRVRQEVAAGRLRHQLVAILYFERTGMQSCVHQLALDRNGNIVDAPPSYREFFLQEELALLDRTSD